MKTFEEAMNCLEINHSSTEADKALAFQNLLDIANDVKDSMVAVCYCENAALLFMDSYRRTADDEHPEGVLSMFVNFGLSILTSGIRIGIAMERPE